MMISLLVLICLMVNTPDDRMENRIEELMADSAAACSSLQSALKAELMAAMKEGGPTAAIQVCSTRAGAVAADVGRETGLEIGRTSLRVRNQANAPDSWEREVLLRFNTLLAEGTPMDELIHAEIVEVEEKPVFRYMKAIGTGGLCLTCHGTDLSEGVKQAVDSHYPEDRATGYAVGDVRGAFTVSRALDPEKTAVR